MYFDRVSTQLELPKTTELRFFCGSTSPGWVYSERRLPSSPPYITSFEAIGHYLQFPPAGTRDILSKGAADVGLSIKQPEHLASAKS